eukprot:6443539-Amphidinium_carterae.1
MSGWLADSSAQAAAGQGQAVPATEKVICEMCQRTPSKESEGQRHVLNCTSSRSSSPSLGNDT